MNVEQEIALYQHLHRFMRRLAYGRKILIVFICIDGLHILILINHLCELRLYIDSCKAFQILTFSIRILEQDLILSHR